LVAAGQILARYNTRLAPRSKEVSSGEILSLVLDCWGLDPDKHLPSVTEAFFNFFQQSMCAYPESVQALTVLRERRIPTGILTDVPYGMPRMFVQRDLDKAGISGLFNTLVTSVEVGVRKPESAGYAALAAEMKIAPEEMLYVGNEPKDIIGACRAGAAAAFIDRTGSGGKHGQQFTISTLLDILDIVGG
jgi:putative hydrolase of the HAD superfamily